MNGEDQDLPVYTIIITPEAEADIRTILTNLRNYSGEEFAEIWEDDLNKVIGNLSYTPHRALCERESNLFQRQFAILFINTKEVLLTLFIFLSNKIQTLCTGTDMFIFFMFANQQENRSH
jgi:hypothetical protein